VTDAATVTMLRGLFALLREDAAPEALASTLTGLEPQLAEVLKPLVDDAAEVAAQLADRRRREAELAALYETAGDLSSERDIEAVLQAIVGRARTLLDTDAAYLMLHDHERGDTYMRVTDGIRTTAFKQARLALGDGLGGLVAKTREPYSTADYLADTRFVHTVDEEVSGEGLVAIQGVPLVRGDRVIGVLFAANRRARPFTEEEVALLISLANHATIAIENATLIEDLRRALRELQEAHVASEEHRESVERAAALHDRLTNIVLEGGGMASVAQTLCDVLGGGLLVVDVQGRVITAAGTGPLLEAAQQRGALPPGSPVARAVRDACVRSDAPRRSTRVPGSDEWPPTWVTPVVAGPEVLGALVLVRPSIEAADIRSLERGALVTALILLNERTVAEAEHRMRGELFDDLFTLPIRDSDGLRRRAALMGLDLSRAHTVLLASAAGSRTQDLCEAAVSYASAQGGLAAAHDGKTVAVLPADRPAGELARDMSARLGHALGEPVTVGASVAAAGVEGFAESYRDARQCLDVLTILDRHGDWATPEDLGIYGVLLAHADHAALEQFVQRVLGPVIEYDAQRSSELERTMLVFFDNDGNLAKTAASLYVHVNTLYQRLDRIGRLLGTGWRHGDAALHVHLALKLRKAVFPAR
jgi:DNA-binding PucR family transcriptional regulator